ncbi:carbohydrate-binding module family 21 protein [Lentinula edodes]|uniref:Carbohydrate-binding module family 21 protein n=1 Tax=Lentinula edodes TaxID=5353 RepID=A0A1Q3EHA4_LENED|nr:carbohydrate-binding module family 21 protein [Lentinula edodes]
MEVFRRWKAVKDLAKFLPSSSTLILTISCDAMEAVEENSGFVNQHPTDVRLHKLSSFFRFGGGASKRPPTSNDEMQLSRPYLLSRHLPGLSHRNQPSSQTFEVLSECLTLSQHHRLPPSLLVHLRPIRGPGAFTPLGSLPRRSSGPSLIGNPRATSATAKRFHFKSSPEVSSSDSSDDDDDDDRGKEGRSNLNQPRKINIGDNDHDDHDDDDRSYAIPPLKLRYSVLHFLHQLVPQVAFSVLLD